MKLGSEILWLSEKDVAALLPMKTAIGLMRQAFLSHGRGQVQMPVKVYLDFEPYGGDLRAMPAYIKGASPAAGVKIVNSNAKNPAKKLPAVSGVMVLNDPKTGLPMGVFAAGILTSRRTGAAGGLAAQVLARPDSKFVGLIGCGRQARTQLEALLAVFNLKEVRVWGKTSKETRDFIGMMAPKIGVPMVSCASVKEACRADIIVTSTPVHKPIVKASWVRPGTHINAIGADAPGKQELDFDLLTRSRVFVDSWDQASHAGEINNAVSAGRFRRPQLAGELGQVVARKKGGRREDFDITIFDSTGLAIQDVAVARFLFQQALKMKKGKVLKFNG
jgi:alanine dehydrogenase